MRALIRCADPGASGVSGGRSHLSPLRLSLRPRWVGKRIDTIGPYLQYCTTRLTDDPRPAATTVHLELTTLGYQRDDRTFTGTLRELNLRPICPKCAAAKKDAPQEQ